MKFTASSEKLLEEGTPGVKVPPGHWAGTERGRRHGRPRSFNGAAAELNERDKHRSRTWVGDFSGVFCPLVVVAVFMGEGSVEDVADVGHRVHADGGALEDGALNKHTSRDKHPGFKSIRSRHKVGKAKRRRYPAVVKTAYTSGFRSSWVGWMNTSPGRKGRPGNQKQNPKKKSILDLGCCSAAASLSSSKRVSTPSSPITEQMRRAFRKVVQRFTRDFCPPSSFWTGKGMRLRIDSAGRLSPPRQV